MLKEFSKDHAYVSLSSTFIMRARCKHCKSLPIHYFYSKQRNYYISTDKPRKLFDNIVKLHKDLCNNYYLVADPVNFKKLSDFTFSLPFINYNAKLHKNRGIRATKDYSEYVSCSCGRTIWAFYENYAKSRPDIIHRKSVYKYPQRFEY